MMNKLLLSLIGVTLVLPSLTCAKAFAKSPLLTYSSVYSSPHLASDYPTYAESPSQAIPQGYAAKDSALFAPLGAKIDEYIRNILTLPIAEQEEECDFLVCSCKDSLTRQFVTKKLYDSYAESHVMGAENIAVHIADAWILSGKVPLGQESEMLAVRFYADLNRASLIGHKAPSLALQSSRGSDTLLYSRDSDRYSVLFFYDTHCPSCLAEAAMLRTFLDTEPYPIDFNAVYTGEDDESWRTFVKRHLDISSPSVRSSHCHDPFGQSDFTVKYAVIQTPKLFLIAPDRTIVGRELDVPALAALLESEFENRFYRYGSDKSNSLMDRIIEASGGVSTPEAVDSLTDMIVAAATDSLTFRHVVGDLLYYYSSKEGRAYKEGDKYLIDRYIIPNKKIWSASHDSLSVLAYAGLMSDILSKAMPGTKLPAVEMYGRLSRGSVPGSVMQNMPAKTSEVKKDIHRETCHKPKSDRRKASPCRYNLSKIALCKPYYVLFYSPDCATCCSYIERADSLMEVSPHVPILFVDMSLQGNCDTAILDAFDLSSLPQLIYVDRKGMIVARYLDLLEIDNLERPL